MEANVPRTTKAVIDGQTFETWQDYESAATFRRRDPEIRWESNPVLAAFREPALVRAVLVDFDGEPRTDTYPETRLEVDGRWFVPAPIVEGILVAEIDFGYLEGEHVVRLVGAPVIAEVLSVRM